VGVACTAQALGRDGDGELSGPFEFSVGAVNDMISSSIRQKFTGRFGFGIHLDVTCSTEGERDT